MTFLVQKDRMYIISKLQRDVYLTASVYALQEVITVTGLCLGLFWNRMRNMSNRGEVMKKLRKACPLVANIFTNQQASHYT